MKPKFVIKRLFDIGLSALALFGLIPFMASIAILIRYSTSGPALLAQERVGHDEKLFKCYKFRTMAIGAPQAGSHDVPETWITPLGKKLRATKLDELPQLFNVLRGEMSLVGPRPCLPNQSEVIAARRQHGAFSMKPGITGLAQLSRIDMSTPTTLAKADKMYIEDWTLGRDLWILAATILGILSRRWSKPNLETDLFDNS